MDGFLSYRAILMGLGFLGAGTALVNIVLPVQAVHYKFSSWEIASLAAAYYLGYFLGCFYTSKLIRKIGHIRSFICAAAVLGICTLGFSLASFPSLWMTFRLMSGLSVACIYMITEAWINEAASSENHARVISIYRVVDLGSIALGQLLIGLFIVNSEKVFITASIFMSLGVITLSLTSSRGPSVVENAYFNLKKVLEVSRIATLTSFVEGMGTSVFFGLVPAFLASIDQIPHRIGLIMSATVLAGVGAQFGVGYLADRMDREKLIAGMAFLVALLSAVLAIVYQYVFLLTLVMLFWGALIFTMYSLAVAIANDRRKYDELLQVSGSLLLLYSMGAVVGPWLGTIYIDYFGYAGIFVFTGCAYFVLGCYAIVRKILALKPVKTRDDYVAVPSTSPVILEMDPRGEEDTIP